MFIFYYYDNNLVYKYRFPIQSNGSLINFPLTSLAFLFFDSRYAMLVDNGKIVKQFVEEKPSDLKVSSVDNVLSNL